MDAPDLYPPSSVSHLASAHIRSIYSYSLHILQHSCPLNLARYTLLRRIDRPFYFLRPLWSLPHPQPLRLTRILLSPSLARVPLLALSPPLPRLSLLFRLLDLPA